VVELLRSLVQFCYDNIMSIITVQDIQQNLPDFLRRLESGESFLVVRDERPLAEVRPVPAPIARPRPFGLCAGQFTVPANFDQPLPDDILKEFEGT
jgi:antitoxin (DNA-binding transcriptional repressor) of toxin-antitoxin stability system